MQIIWNDNPLATVVKIDDNERGEMKRKLLLDDPELTDLDKHVAM